MVDLKKTIFVCLSIIVFLGIISIASNVFASNSSRNENYVKLSITDPDVTILYDKIEKVSELRKASYDSGLASNEDIIKTSIMSLTTEDYVTKTIKPNKIICQVTNSISFVSSKKCKVKIINNDTIMSYQRKIFNTEKVLEYIDLKINGLNCKNNGKKYYCLVNDYNDNRKNYTVIKDAYKDGENIIIRDYYLSILIGNNDRCLSFFNENYCINNSDEEVNIDDSKIVDYGSLYVNVFVKNENDEYYLAKSFIANE